MPAKRRDVSDLLLAWYDAHARVLPWRALPGKVADPYRVWLSEVMLQQTTVAAVRPRFAAWVARWPTVEALAAADEAEVMAAWAGLGYYARARNLVKTARAVAGAGAFPRTEAGLRELPGLGAYTAAAVAAIAFGERAVVVDANVERVVARLFAISQKGAGVRAAADAVTPDARAGDFAQGLMDLGSAICTSRAPKCLLCPLRGACAGYASGEPEAFPAKKAKAEKPQRYGTVFWLERDGAVLLVRRPPRGLLGGMRALPTGEWTDAPARSGMDEVTPTGSGVPAKAGTQTRRQPIACGETGLPPSRENRRNMDAADPRLAGAPVDADWTVLDATVTHVFTHFRLQLALAVAEAGAQTVAGEWWPVDRLDEAGLPGVFAKAAAAIRRAR